MSDIKQIALEVYRENHYRYIFEVPTENLQDPVIVTFGIKKELKDVEAIVNFEVLPTDEGADWDNGLVAVNIVPGDYSKLEGGEYRFDLTTNFTGTPNLIKTHYYGTITIVHNVTSLTPYSERTDTLAI